MAEKTTLVSQAQGEAMRRDPGLDLPVNFNLEHLTVSQEFKDLCDSDRRLSDFKAFGDQIASTNNIDPKRAEYYRRYVGELVQWTLINTDEDDLEFQFKLEKVQFVLQQIIDGTIGGKRGKLATTIRREFIGDGDAKPQQGWLSKLLIGGA
jgi:hypothetical protein